MLAVLGAFATSGIFALRWMMLEPALKSRPLAPEPQARTRRICGRPPPCKVLCSCFDQIACVHMYGLLVRSHRNAGQDGIRDTSSKQLGDLVEGHCVKRSVSRLGSIDHAICSLSCKFWHRLSTVADELLPVSGRSLSHSRRTQRHGFYAVDVATHHHLPGDAGDLVGQRDGDRFRRFALEQLDEPG